MTYLGHNSESPFDLVWSSKLCKAVMSKRRSSAGLVTRETTGVPLKSTLLDTLLMNRTFDLSTKIQRRTAEKNVDMAFVLHVVIRPLATDELEETAIVASATKMINDVYEVAEKGLWLPQTQRMTVEEVVQKSRQGDL